MRAALFFILLMPALVMAEPLRVFTSVLPLQTVVAAIGGEQVVVQSLVRSGFNPHTYDPTPQQITALAGAELYVRTGVPFEDAWMKRIRAANPTMAVLDVREGVSMRAIGAHDHDHHDAEHEALDPHVWTSPVKVMQIAQLVHAQLTALDPDHIAAYDANHAALVLRLEEMHAEMQQLLTPLKGYRFMVFHPAWGYFADEYGLVQVPIQREGKEPGAKALANLIRQAKKQNIKVIFVQPQFDQRLAQQVANAIEGEVIAVDPLAGDIIFNLRSVAQQFAEALQP